MEALAYCRLNKKCQLYLFLYMLQSIAAGLGFFLSFFLHGCLDLSTTAISYMVSFYVLGHILGSWITAKILDTTNPFLFSGISLILQSLGFVLISFMRINWLLSLSIFILGTSSYIYIICNNYLITLVAGNKIQDRAMAVSLLNVAANIGMGLGGLFASIFVKRFAIMLFIGMAIVLFVISLFYFMEKKQFGIVKPVKNLSKSYHDSCIYRLSLLTIFCLGIIFAQQRISYAIFLSTNYGDKFSGFIFLLNSVLIIILLPTITKFAIKDNKLIKMGGGIFCLGLSMFLLLFVNNSYCFMIIICLILTLGEMLGTTLSQILCFQYAKTNEQGKAMGYYKFLYAWGTILGNLLSGNVLDKYIWIACACIGCFVLAICYLVNIYKDI